MPSRQVPETRERLLSAATALFAERGFHGTTVRDIAERAGANVAAANYHFGSKEALYLGVLRTQFGQVQSLLRERDALPPGADLDALSRAELRGILRARIAAMLDFLLGPPAALHGRLMLREMADPSEALPVVVAEFIAPQITEMGAVLGRLAPELAPGEIERCIFSIVAQILYYSWTRPVQLLLRKRSEYPRGMARELAEHIAEFSLGGLERLARRRRGGRDAA